MGSVTTSIRKASILNDVWPRLSWEARAEIIFILIRYKFGQSHVVRPALIAIAIWAGFLILGGDAFMALALASLAGYAALNPA